MAHSSTSLTILRKYHDAIQIDKKGSASSRVFVTSSQESRWLQKADGKSYSKGQRQSFVQQVNLSLLSMIIKLLIYSLVTQPDKVIACNALKPAREVDR